MDNALRELKYAIRTLTRTPIIATVVVLSLGIGVGVNTVIFSWIQALMFRPLPGVADASALDTDTRPCVVGATSNETFWSSTIKTFET